MLPAKWGCESDQAVASFFQYCQLEQVKGDPAQVRGLEMWKDGHKQRLRDSLI